MERTISGMVGKGSVNHNTRAFTAKNVDSDRSGANVHFCNEDIKQVQALNHKVIFDYLFKSSESNFLLHKRFFLFHAYEVENFYLIVNSQDKLYVS